MEHTLTVISANGEEFVIRNSNDMWVLSFLPLSPSYQIQYESIEGRNGDIVTDRRCEGRMINAKIAFRSHDIFDFYLFRNQVFRLFDSQEPFYLISSREPGKRWLVRVDNTYEIEPKAGKYGIFDVSFKSESPYAESKGTTQSPFTTESELWQIGQGLLADESSQQYTFTSASFNLYNAGDVVIDPREVPLVITFTGASSNLKIKNVTTGEEWQYSGITISGDTITLDCVKSLKNGISIFKDTNYKLITIAPGWNDFAITGASGTFSISFDFRYLYL